MTKEAFGGRMGQVWAKGPVLPPAPLRERLKAQWALETEEERQADLPCCAEELAGLIVELMKVQRGRTWKEFLWRKLCHVQWSVWRLQELSGISDADLLAGIQASIRPGNAGEGGVCGA